MKNTILFFILFLMLNSCQNAQVNKASNKVKEVKNYSEIVNKQLALNSKDNTSFLDFVLGSSKGEAQKHISQLIKEKKLKQQSTWDLTFAQIEGYPYQLQLNESLSCDCAVTTTYLENKLYTLTVMVFGDCKTADLKSFLTKIYGEPNYEEIKKEKYPEQKKCYWIMGNKEILLSDIASFNAIEFTDLRLKMKDKEFWAQIDTLQTETGKEKAKETKGDFK